MARGTLNAATVVDAAADLADDCGLAQLTLAKLAGELGIKPPSLHKHIHCLGTLHRALALRGLAEANRRMTKAAMGRSGDAALLAIARAYREFAAEHPGLYAASLRAPDPKDAEWTKAGAEVVGIAVAVLEAYGLSGNEALHATRSVRAIIHGFVALESVGGFGSSLKLEESLDHLILTFAHGLRADGVSAAAKAARLRKRNN